MTKVDAFQAAGSRAVSVGVAVLGLHGDDMPDLLAAADLALYRAKEAGRNQVCLFGPPGDVVPRPR